MKFKSLNKDVHILTTDLNQKEESSSGLILLPKRTNDHRGSHPDRGTVVESSLFDKGTEVITGHFTFEDEYFQSKEIGKDKGTPLFLSTTEDIYFTVKDGELVPVEGVLLCENVEGKFIDTNLELPEDYEGKRRDVVKVLKVWEGCLELKSGDYIFLGFGGDYRFTFAGKEYIRVDTRRGDAFLRLNSPEWRSEHVRKHLKRDKNY